MVSCVRLGYGRLGSQEPVLRGASHPFHSHATTNEKGLDMEESCANCDYCHGLECVLDGTAVLVTDVCEHYEQKEGS